MPHIDPDDDLDFFGGASLAPPALAVALKSPKEGEPPEPRPETSGESSDAVEDSSLEVRPKRISFREKGSVRRRAQMDVAAFAISQGFEPQIIEKPMPDQAHILLGDQQKLFAKVHVTRSKFQWYQKLQEAAAFAQSALGEDGKPVIFYRRPNQRIMAIMDAGDFCKLVKAADRNEK